MDSLLKLLQYDVHFIPQQLLTCTKLSCQHAPVDYKQQDT
jgi:hypothetical protein